MRKTLAALVLAVAACATPQSQLQAGLMDAGLSRNQAGCMAERMDNKLSMGQLMKLRSLKNLKKDEPGNTSLNRFMHNIRALNDPEIVVVTTRAALGCAISG
jgi:hypothetical protein